MAPSVNASVQDSVQMWAWAFSHQDAVLLAGLASSGPQRCWPEAAGLALGQQIPDGSYREVMATLGSAA